MLQLSFKETVEVRFARACLEVESGHQHLFLQSSSEVTEGFQFWYCGFGMSEEDSWFTRKGGNKDGRRN